MEDFQAWNPHRNRPRRYQDTCKPTSHGSWRTRSMDSSFLSSYSSKANRALTPNYQRSNRSRMAQIQVITMISISHQNRSRKWPNTILLIEKTQLSSIYSKRFVRKRGIKTLSERDLQRENSKPTCLVSTKEKWLKRSCRSLTFQCHSTSMASLTWLKDYWTSKSKRLKRWHSLYSTIMKTGTSASLICMRWWSCMSLTTQYSCRHTHTIFANCTRLLTWRRSKKAMKIMSLIWRLRTFRERLNRLSKRVIKRRMRDWLRQGSIISGRAMPIQRVGTLADLILRQNQNKMRKKMKKKKMMKLMKIIVTLICSLKVKKRIQ